MRVFCSVSEGVGVNIIGGSKNTMESVGVYESAAGI